MEALRPTPVLVLAVIALAACASHGVDEAPYVRAGIVVRSVPRLPASRLVNSYSLADRSGPATAYVSYYDYSTPSDWSAARVLRCYERRLRSSGWTLTTSWSNERTFLREPATLRITASRRDVLVSVDHDRHTDGTR